MIRRRCRSGATGPTAFRIYADVSDGEVDADTFDRIYGGRWERRDIGMVMPRRKQLTVGELVTALLKYPRDMVVLVDNPKSGWFRHAGHVEGPTYFEGEWCDTETGYIRPTIFLGESFDSRSI